MVTGGRGRALLPQLGMPDPLLPAQELDSLAESRETRQPPIRKNGAARAGRTVRAKSTLHSSTRTGSTMHVWVIVGRVGKAAVMGVTDLG